MPKNPVAGPDRKLKYPGLRNPFQFSFVAVDETTGIIGRSVKIHVFCRIFVGYEGDDAVPSPGDQIQSGLFFYLPQQTFFRTFLVLKLSAYTDPFIFIEIMSFFCSVKKQITVLFFDITECGIFHR